MVGLILIFVTQNGIWNVPGICDRLLGYYRHYLIKINGRIHLYTNLFCSKFCNRSGLPKVFINSGSWTIHWRTVSMSPLETAFITTLYTAVGASGTGPLEGITDPAILTVLCYLSHVYCNFMVPRVLRRKVRPPFCKPQTSVCKTLYGWLIATL